MKTRRAARRALWRRSWPLLLMWALAVFWFAVALIPVAMRDVASMTWAH